MKPNIPYRRNTTLEWIEFRDTVMFDTGLLRVLDSLKWSTFKFEADVSNIHIWYIWLGNFVVSYTSKEHRDRERENILKFDLLANTETLQYPRFRWEFEYEGKFYNIIWVNEAFEWETTDILYKWIVINTQEFISRNPVGKLVERVKAEARGIMWDKKIV